MSGLSLTCNLTTPYDRWSPIISLVSSGTPGSGSATITWTTDKASDSQVEYGFTDAYGSSTTLDSNMVTSHSVVVSGLSSSSVYHFRVRSKDANGYLGMSSDGSFQTAVVGAAGTWYAYDGPAYPNGVGAHNKHMKCAFDNHRGKVYLGGGDYPINDQLPGVHADNSHENFWEIDLGFGDTAPTWTKLLTWAEGNTAGFPEGRCCPCLDYDSITRRVWMHNGMNAQPDGSRPTLIRGGIWTLNPTEAVASQRLKKEGPGIPDVWSAGSSHITRYLTNRVYWAALLGATIYAPTMYSSSVPNLCKYDLRGIAVGGADPNKDNWSSNSLMADPSPYLGITAVCVDTKRGHIIFYCTWPGPSSGSGGSLRGETWELRPPSTLTLISSYMLPMKSSFGLAYDSINDVVAVFGGGDTHEGSDLYHKLNGFWILPRDPADPNYHTWYEPSVSGDIPTPRLGEAFCHDSHHNKFFVFGGTAWPDHDQTVVSGQKDYADTPTVTGRYGHEIFTISLGNKYEHTDLAGLTAGQAHDCGAYPFTDLGDDGGGINANTATDYSGFSYSPIEHCMLMGPTGGHSATFDDAVKRFSLRPGAPLQWTRDYARTLRSGLHTGGVGKTNIIDSNGFWTTSGNPISRHTYKMTPFCPNIGKFAVLSTGGVFKSGDNITWSPDLYLQGTPILQNGSKILLYDPLVKASASWSVGSTTTPLWGNWDASCHDPVSGKVLVVGSNDNHGAGKLYTYDPQTFAMASGPSTVVGGVQNEWEEFNIVYCPENDYFYIITKNSLMVVALKFDRANINNSTFTAVTVTGSHPVLDYIGYAWDTKNKIIGGGPVAGNFYALTIDPTDPFKASWSSKAISVVNGSYGVGTLVIHSFACDYDQSNNGFLCICDSTGTGGGRRTFFIRWA